MKSRGLAGEVGASRVTELRPLIDIDILELLFRLNCFWNRCATCCGAGSAR